MLITTCDRYHAHLRIMLHLLEKYWQPLPLIDILGFKEPEFDLPTRARFISLGDMNDFPLDKWSTPIIDYFKRCYDDRVIWMLDDYYVYRQVDTRAVRVLWDYANQYKFTLKIDLAEDRLHAEGTDLNYGYIDYDGSKRLDLIKSSPESQYHMSLWPGIFRVEHLLRVMIPDENPWQLEISGTSRARNMSDVIVLGTKQSLVEIRLGARGGHGEGQLGIDGLKPEDQAELKELGYV